ncbi:MAG TPA: CHAT domain-containing protein [Pyrinomonadaceae bacterium]|nr:CHAT domain-containing protein [Pyrinomonadaceae bacterium]
MRSKKFRSAGVLVLILIAWSDSFSQKDPGLSTPNEHHTQIARLLAQSNYDQVILESRVLIDRWPEHHQAYIALAKASAKVGQLEQARAWFESLLARMPSQPMAYAGLAAISEGTRDYAGAVQNYQKCLAQRPDAEAVAVLMAFAYVRLKQGAEGEAYFKSLIAARADSLAGRHGLAWLYSLVKRHAEALAEFQQLITLQPRNTLAHSNKALTLLSADRTGEAVEAFQICLRLQESNPDDELELIARSRLGYIYLVMGNYPAALKNLERVLELARAFHSLSHKETALAHLGSVHYRQNDYIKTEEYWRRALEVSKTIAAKNSRETTFPQNHLGNLGDVYYHLGDIAAAKQAYSESLKLSIEVKDERNQSSVLNALGDLYVAQADFNQAQPIYVQALALGVKLDNLGNQVGALLGLAALHRRLGNYQLATEYAQRVLTLLEGQTSPMLRGQALNSLGLSHLRFNKFPEALAAFQKTLAIDADTIGPHIRWTAHAGAARAYVQSAQRDKAREHYLKAIDLIEKVRAGLGGDEAKAGFLQDKIEIYKEHIALLLDLHRLDGKSHHGTDAFHYNERARARAFFDRLAETKIDPEQDIAPDLLKQKRELHTRINKLTAQLIKERSSETSRQDQVLIGTLKERLDQADKELSDWLRELRRRNPRYASLQYPEPVTLAATQRLLDDQTILLSYSLAEPASFLFVITNNNFQVKRLPSETLLNKRVQDLLAAITNKNNPATERYRLEAIRLSQDLLPDGRLLAGKKALVIVADGALHRLPFEVLFRPGTSASGDLRRWPYLIQKFAVSYVPSASVLAELQNQAREMAPKGFIAFGDPLYDHSANATLRLTNAGDRLNLQRLPYSRTEIDGIARLFPKDDYDLFFGAEASEENVKAPGRLSRYRMVHFSTHGYVNEARPRFSGLLLSLPTSESPSAIRNLQSEDGVLSAYEIFDLKLKADLVVLSACETGLGKEIRGEGLMSLMRAFMYAGTPSVLVSLWNVNDETAADLMIRFYRHLKTPGTRKNEALRLAQLETIEDNGFAFFWAPFVLIGKP